MPAREKLLRMLKNRGLLSSVGRSIEYGAVQTGVTETVYRTLVPWPYYVRYNVRNRDHAPLNPFRLLRTSPDSVSRITGRESSNNYPDRRQSLGAVEGGAWDRPRRPGSETLDDPTLDHVRFAETVFFKGMRERFFDGRDWDETRLFAELVEYVDDASWRGYETPEEVSEHLRNVDVLYESMRSDGYRRQRDIDYDRSDGSLGFVRELVNEVAVDIGRDGELLFVDGKHRLALAKILDIEQIPVVVLVRHEKWMDYRDEVYSGAEAGIPPNHPDLQKTFVPKLRES